MYLMLANLVAIAHITLTLCVLSGTLAAITGALRGYRWLERIYYTMAGAVITSQFAYGECIMTVWEKTLRNRNEAGSAYRNSFLGHYLPWIPHVVFDWVGPGLMILALFALPFWRRRDRQRRTRLDGGLENTLPL